MKTLRLLFPLLGVALMATPVAPSGCATTGSITYGNERYGTVTYTLPPLKGNSK